LHRNTTLPILGHIFLEIFMKSAFLFILTTLIVTQKVNSQDRVILINGDTLAVQVQKISKGQVVINDGSIERALNSLFISKVIPGKGNTLIIRDLPENLDFEPNLLIVKYSQERYSEIALTFPNAIKHEFKTEHFDAYKDLPDEYFTGEGSGVSDYQLAEKYSKFMAYGCNAFLVVVSQTENGFKYVFYSNPISSRKIKENLIGRSYKLVDSQVSEGTTRYLLELGAKPFTMTLNEGGQCIFKQGSKETLLEYKILNDAKIFFTDPKRPSDPTAYQIVFINDRYIRYTQFMKDDKIVTRKVEVIK
jgi:hypothetical protein